MQPRCASRGRVAGHWWNEATFFARLAEICTPEGVQAARRLYTFDVQGGAEVKWNDGPYASVTFHLLIRGKPTSTFTLEEWMDRRVPQGNLRVNFAYLAGKGVSLQVLSRLAETLSTIPGVKERYAGLEAAHFLKRPALPLNQILPQPGRRDGQSRDHRAPAVLHRRDISERPDGLEGRREKDSSD